MRKFLVSKGVTFLFETKMIDFQKIESGYQITVLQNHQKKILNSDLLVLAIGHSARDTYEMLYRLCS